MKFYSKLIFALAIAQWTNLQANNLGKINRELDSLAYEGISPFSRQDRNRDNLAIPLTGWSSELSAQGQYAAHTNTFSLPHAFGSVAWRSEDGRLFFAEVFGRMDTHNPEKTYEYVQEDNISLSNVGFAKEGLFVPWFRAWVLGAASHRFNPSTLLLTNHISAESEGLIDDELQKEPETVARRFPTGPGARLEFFAKGFTLGYAQGDFQHGIPITVQAKYEAGFGELGVTSLFYNMNTEAYETEDWSNFTELFWRARHTSWFYTNASIVTTTMAPAGLEGSTFGRLEAAILYKGFVPAARYAVHYTAGSEDKFKHTGEGSLKYYYAPGSYTGIQTNFNDFTYLQFVMQI